MLWKDIQKETFNVDGKELSILSFFLKSPKTDRIGNGDRVEIFEVPGSFMCPIKAFSKWEKFSSVRVDKNMPVFREKGGKCFTGKKLNTCLNELTAGLKKQNINIESHSFRAGVSSIMAAQGHSAESIKAIGCLELESWKCYSKLPRLNRAKMAADICCGL